MKDLLLAPALGNLHFPWLLVFRERSGEAPPEYFLTHGRNYSKFASRKGFRIIGHIKEKNDAIACCRWHNEQLHGKRRGAHQTTTSKSGVSFSPTNDKHKIIIPKDIKD